MLRRPGCLVLLVQTQLLLRIGVTTELAERGRQRVVGRSVTGKQLARFLVCRHRALPVASGGGDASESVLHIGAIRLSPGNLLIDGSSLVELTNRQQALGAAQLRERVIGVDS